MKVSVIIPTLDRVEDLRRALRSLERQTRRPAQILVIDQSEQPQTRELLRDLAKSFSDSGISLDYFHADEKSAAKARNVGTDRATGDILSYLDDDVELCEDYYEKIIGHLEDHPSWGGVSGSLIQEDMIQGIKGAFRRLFWKLFLLNDGKGRMTPSGFGYPIYERALDRPMRVEMFHGCNMNFRREAVGDVRFDPWFTGYSFREDVDFCYQIAQKAELWMVPDARLHHHESKKNRLALERLKRMEINNCFYVYQKHRAGRPGSKWLFAYSLTGLVALDAAGRWINPTDDKKIQLKAGLAAYREVLSRL